MGQKKPTTKKTTSVRKAPVASKTTPRKTSSATAKRPVRKNNVTNNDASATQSSTSRFGNLNRKRLSLIIGIIVVIVLLYLARGLFIAALVNGQPISRFAVISKLEKQGGKQTLDSLVTEKLIENEAAKQHITVSQSDVNSQIATIEKNIQSQGATLDQALAQQGMSRQDLNDQVRLQIMVNKMVGTPKVTDKEITDYISQNKEQYPNGADAATKNQVKQQLAQQKQQQEAQTLVQKLRTDAHIVYIDYQ